MCLAMGVYLSVFFLACGAAKPEKELIFISSHVKECEVMGAEGLTDVKMSCIRLGWSARRFAR